MKRYTFIFAMLFAVCSLSAQTYVEPADDAAPDRAAWQALSSGNHITWADADVHYDRHAVPAVAERRDTVITAWQGERVGLRGLLYTHKGGAKNVQLVVKGKVGTPAPEASWLRYVISDSFSTCGYHPDSLKPYTVAEVVDLPHTSLALKSDEVRPFWVSVEVPRDLPAGEYLYSLQLKGAKAAPLTFRVNVIDRQLPEPHDYKFHLDLWQQPYSVSRFYKVEPWSDAHLDLLRPYMKELARCGQKVVSAILFYEPWGQQSNDKFEPMVHTTLCADGSWSYDYTIFDRWVEFMAECGIDQQVDCYSMVPWDMTFRYYDEAKDETINLKTKTDTPEYRELWINFLRAFAAHLKEKGWFEKTCIAMDERGLEDMMRAYHLAQYAVPGMKMTLAGNHHKELSGILYDYAVAYGQDFSADERAARRAAGQHSTYYTCCSDAHPGLFSNSNPVDAAFLGLYAAAADFDGWLHWSWINWTDDPLRDSRFFLFAPGDTYLFYPGPRSSLRHERLLEGIQQFEKIQILKSDPALAPLFKAACEETADDPARLADLLKRFKAVLNK